MESSEDDAGTATNASRRTSAREKAIGQIEDVNATSSLQQQSSQATTSCEAPAMSEDNFDGDSVSSPSAHDVNTSTEAILDMIDEIVDGPGAPKRLPFSLEPDDSVINFESVESSQSVSDEGELQSIVNPPQPSDAVPAASAKSEDVSRSESVDVQAESTSENANVVEASTACVDIPQTSSPQPVNSDTAECNDVTKPIAPSPDVPPSSPPPNIPSSSETQTIKPILDSNESVSNERTVKCVTSSDVRDTVTVESAESTSSDNSVSEGRVTVAESATRSPLRRRLIRPAPSDRRPDSTVSSTVDSQSINIDTSELTSECIVKDVSSSSDAVPPVHGNVKPEEIRNVSEVSICQAETSMCPPKKIKLIRQKITPPVCHSLNTEKVNDAQSLIRENYQCQSTSSERLSSEPCTDSSNLISTSKSDNEIVKDIVQPETLPDERNKECIDQPPQSNVVPESLPNELNRECIDQSTTTNVSESLHDVQKKEHAEQSPECNAVPESVSNTEESVNQLSASNVPEGVVDELKKECIDKSESSVIESMPKEQNKECIDQSSESVSKTEETVQTTENILQESLTATSATSEYTCDNSKKVPPIKLNLSIPGSPEVSSVRDTSIEEQNSESSSSNIHQTEQHCTKQVPKLTIKLGNKLVEEPKSPVPKLTIKPIRPPVVSQVIDNKDQVSSVTKLNIKPIPKRPEKVTDFHQTSSSSEISESEYSENDESASTSDQASASDQGPLEVVPKVTIKLGKPGTETEGKFYTEQTVPKLTIKGIQNSENEDQDSQSKLKVVMSQSDETQAEKIPKLTIKTVVKSEGQPLSPKLTIKPIRPPDHKDNIMDQSESQQIPKLKISTESFTSSTDVKESTHLTKFTIKPITKTDIEALPKTPKKLVAGDTLDNIPVVTKLNIKPIVKPTESGETSESLDDKVPVVPKLNIKPIVKPKDSEVDSRREDVPKITKLNIKPIKSPETNSSEEKDCDDLNAAVVEHSIPVITKLNIKPILKPFDEDVNKDSENQSSETGNSSDDNNDQIPIVTKLNIKPLCRPIDNEDSKTSASLNEDTIPVISKLNIKPLVKPDDGNKSPSSPKKESLKNYELRSSTPTLTKLNIKPIIKPDESKTKATSDIEEVAIKNPPLVMKINMKAINDSNANENMYSIEKNDSNSGHYNNVSENIPSVSKLNIKPIVKPPESDAVEQVSSSEVQQNINCTSSSPITSQSEHKDSEHVSKAAEHKENCISNLIIENKDEYQSTLKDQSKEHKNILLTNKESSSDSIQDNTKTEELNIDTSSNTNILDNKTQDHINQNLKTISHESDVPHSIIKQQSPVQNCTLLKKLLEIKKDVSNIFDDSKSRGSKSNCSTSTHLTHEPVVAISRDVNLKLNSDFKREKTNVSVDKSNDISGATVPLKVRSIQELCKEANENITKPLEINVSDKATSHNSDQDSPRIILKINKTDHGPSAKIITEDVKRPETPTLITENTHNYVNDVHQKKTLLNSRRKTQVPVNTTPMGKRLRSSRIVQSADKASNVRRVAGKRTSTSEINQPPTKEPELSVLESKRLKLGQLLSNKALTITPILSKSTQLSPNKQIEHKQVTKTVNHSLLNNENCSKNGNSKLHNILSNLQAKQMQALPFNDISRTGKDNCLTTELESSTSTGSSDVVIEILHSDKSQSEIPEMIFHDNSESHDFNITPEEILQDPLEVENSKITSNAINDRINIPKLVEMTPQPKKRGRPRKLPVSEGSRPITLPTPALEERPQRSLRLSRDRPVVLLKPRGGRGRGRGARRLGTTPAAVTESVADTANKVFVEQQKTEEEIDPTSSRIKLPRMTEALDKMPSMSSTPLSSRRRNSSSSELKLFGENPELKVVLECTLPKVEDSFMKSPEMTTPTRGGRGGRGSRGGRGRGAAKTPRGRGRGRGGGRGAMYMKETMGIYGRVCGPATTTVQLFEEETCMMDDNATPAKPSHLLDEDSQSSVKSSTNDSNKMKKLKFADLFDSNKIWTAADVKEYTWPPAEKTDVEHQVMMIQEQVAMFLGVKSFKRRYPELKRRTIVGEERDYVLSKELVTEALCDLGITAVDASEVLDIMLSDYPHKYEEYRSHQRVRQLSEPVVEPMVEPKAEDKSDKTDVKVEVKPADSKPEPPKVDPEKTRQDLALAAAASASEWNARVNAARARACADLQSLGVARRRPPPAAPPPLVVRPPHGFYPHALLPGQYQHSYRTYPSHHLRYFPLNTALEAPPMGASPACSSESDGESSSRASLSDRSDDAHRPAKRKKLTKVKRSSQAEASASSAGTSTNTNGGSSGGVKEEPREEVDTCRVCKLRLEANRKYTHERFLVCANCNAKLHPSCVELSADTIRKCREYAWQCAECKSCCACSRPADDDKMLFCDLCDRGFHIYCVGLPAVPGGRWHCVECAVCKSCGAREPGGPGAPGGPGTPGTPGGPGTPGAGGAEWHHQTRRGPGGHKLYSHSLCTPCARLR